MLRATVIVCGVLLGILLAAIFVALGHGNVWEGLSRLVTDPWGVVTLLDLSVALLFIATWMAVMEPQPIRATVWIVALFILGNMVTLVFLLCRTRKAERFSDLFLPPHRSHH